MEISTPTQKQSLQLQQVQVVPQREIPLNDVISPGNRRDFNQHALLSNFLPSLHKLAFSWIILRSSEQIKMHPSAKASMLIVCQGKAKLLENTLERNITAGDTILLSPQYNCDIKTEIGQDLVAVLLQFPAKKTATLPEYALSFEGLIQHNEARMQRILTNPYFTLLKSDNKVLDNPKARQKFLDSIQIFSDFFQHILFIRQGTCQDPAYHSLFLKHLQEELGHDELLAARSHKHRNHDPILHATSMWFCNQMIILDNLEKTALVHLVLELSGTYYHEMAKKKLGREAPDYYEVHTEVDDIHAQMGADLLRGQPAEVYRRLHNVIDKGWSMLDAMTQRVAHIVENSL